MTKEPIASEKDAWKRRVRLTGRQMSRLARLTGISYNRIIDLGREDKPKAIPTTAETIAICEMIVAQAEKIRHRVRTLEARDPLTEDEFLSTVTNFSVIPVPQDVSIAGKFGMIGVAPANSDPRQVWSEYVRILSEHKSNKDDWMFDKEFAGAKREFSFYRTALCLTHEELAELCGHAPDTIRDWARASAPDRAPHPELLFQMRKKASGWAHKVIMQSEAPSASGVKGIVSPVLPLMYEGAFEGIEFRRTPPKPL